MANARSAFLLAIENDNSLPIEQEAVNLWLNDIENPSRWSVRPILQLVLAVLLHLIWFLKRLPLPQFRAHKLLQKMICWFCKYLVSPEANALILRHFATESNILNFLADNSTIEVTPVDLYPKSIAEMMECTFVDHDQELFRLFAELGKKQQRQMPENLGSLNWTRWRRIEMSEFRLDKKATQIIDFETAHALFMCLFCLLLTREEYRDAINGFNLDQSIAIRVGEIIDDHRLVEMAYNKYPLYLVGPWNLGQRFLMHGFFTEFLYARLEVIRNAEAR